jgi:hypothetical protein
MRVSAQTALILILTFFFVLSGCGRTRPVVSRATQPLRHDPIPGESDVALDLEKIRGAAKSGELKCPFKDECEPTLAMISVVSPDGLDRCSGVLISEDEILTNDHCVNKGVFMKGHQDEKEAIPCADNLFVHFSEVDALPAQHAGCSQIKLRSRESGLQSLDYAIITLDQKIMGRKPLERATGALENHEQARIYRVQMDGEKTGRYDGSQGLLPCQVSYRTFLYPGVDSPSSPLMTFGDCAIQAGNSGSPVLNSQGKLAAIIQGYLSLKEETQLHKQVQEALLDDSFGQVGVGTQLRCIESGLESRVSECSAVPEVKSQTPKEFLAEDSQFNQNNLLPVLSAGNKWVEAYQPQERHRRFVTGPKCGGAAEFESNEMEFRVGFNRFFQAEWRSENRFGERMRMFTANSSAVGEKVSYLSIDGTRVEIDACRLSANR